MRTFSAALFVTAAMSILGGTASAEPTTVSACVDNVGAGTTTMSVCTTATGPIPDPGELPGPAPLPDPGTLPGLGGALGGLGGLIGLVLELVTGVLGGLGGLGGIGL